jgi:acylphosphatase
MLVARRFVVSGRVQGVGFRFFADEAARVEGLSGWVRNLPDGRVEARAEGDREAVERFGRRLARGPGGARVDRIETLEEVPDGRIRSFEIRR